MKHRKSLVVILAVLLVGILAACATPEPTNTPIPPTNTPVLPTNTPVPEVPVLEIIGLDGSTKTLTLDEVKALPATEGQAGIKSSTGAISGPDAFKGVALKDLVAEMGFDDSMGVNVLAEDGYGITFSYDQAVNGAFISYDPGTGDEKKSPDPLTAILAYEFNGQPLDSQRDGILRLVIVSEKGNQVTDGHWAVKWVTTLEFKSLSKEWTLHLEGALTEDMDRATFESGSSPHCHAGSWTDDHAQEWVGIPLWLLAGRVDDEVRHDGPAFNDALADVGYTLDVIAEDGYSVTLDSARIKRNDDIVLAFKVNENPLPDKYFPLRLVGDDLEKNEMVGMVAQIVLHLEGVVAPEPTPEPTPTPASVTVEGDLVIVGRVDQPLGLSEDDLRAMEVVQITAEHPKSGEQEYEGVLLNGLLDQAGVQDGVNKIVITAVDGFSAEVFLAEVRACADCLLGFTNTPGKFKVVMPGLPSNVWVKDVVQIEIQ